MHLFLIWSLLLIAGFALFFFRLHRKNQLYSRFRIRLNIILLLFTLLPTLPALFLIAHLLTQSTQMLLMPGLENALQSALETVRSQTEADGINFFKTFPGPSDWTEGNMEKFSIDAVAGLKRQNSHIAREWSVNRIGDDFSHAWQPTGAIWEEAELGRHSTTVTSNGLTRILVFGPGTDSTLTLAIYPIRPEIAQSKEEILRALRIYSTLSLLKETVIEKNIIWALAFLFIMGLAFISSTIARRIAAGINRPVQDLVTGMSRVADGDLTARIENRARDEFQYLIDRFNTMTKDLEEGRVKLIEAERMAAWQQVARQISHEIKNSLTPISISLHRFRNHFTDIEMPKAVSDSIMTVEDELKSMELLASEFSRFAKMPKPQMKKIDLNRLIMTVKDLLTPSIDPVKITTSLCTQMAMITADREQIKRVLINLIKNSAEACVNNTRIAVSTAPAGESDAGILLIIQDHGRGMSPEIQDQMFQPYFTSKSRGTGLGLAIVRKILQEHQAEIDVESVEGEGTTISITFPPELTL